jgi:hypothetical protein
MAVPQVDAMSKPPDAMYHWSSRGDPGFTTSVDSPGSSDCSSLTPLTGPP